MQNILCGINKKKNIKQNAFLLKQGEKADNERVLYGHVCLSYSLVISEPETHFNIKERREEGPLCLELMSLKVFFRMSPLFKMGSG